MEAGLVVKPGKTVFIVALDIGKVANGLFGFRHRREGMLHPFVLPFPHTHRLLYSFLNDQKFQIGIA